MSNEMTFTCKRRLIGNRIIIVNSKSLVVQEIFVFPEDTSMLRKIVVKTQSTMIAHRLPTNI